MRVEVKVIPRSSQEKVVPVSEGQLKVYLRAPALEGKANEALIGLLSEHFGVKRSAVQIIRGDKQRNKVVDILC